METLFNEEQARFPNTRETGRYMTESGLRRMRRAMMRGRKFAKSLPIVDGKAEEMALHSRIRDVGTNVLAGYAIDFEDPTAARLMCIAYAFGASVALHEEDMYGFIGPGTNFFEVEAQRDLAIVFRVIGEEDRRELYNAHELLDFPKDVWVPNAVGAEAVARLAAAMQGHGHSVYLSTTKEDARDGIDVIIPFSVKSGLCVQVKRDRDLQGIKLSQITSEPFGTGGGIHHGLMRRTWQGTQRFNQRYKVHFSPAIALVGGKPGSLELNFNRLNAA